MELFLPADAPPDSVASQEPRSNEAANVASNSSRIHAACHGSSFLPPRVRHSSDMSAIPKKRSGAPSQLVPSARYKRLLHRTIHHARRDRMTARKLEIRGNLQTAYADVFTPEALNALEALAGFDA